MRNHLSRAKNPEILSALATPAFKGSLGAVSHAWFACSLLSAFLAFLLSAAGKAEAAIPPGYTGKPYKDSTLEVPGRLRLFRFDEGAKGMVWHDFEGTNIWYCKVRAPAAVGLQNMGAGGDKWEPGKAEPGMSLVNGDCYMAQTNTGDWTKYTVNVKEKGNYTLSFLSAASGTNLPYIGVSFLNGTDSVGTGRITLPLTSYFHNWVYAKNLATIALDTGLQVMRFDIVGNGPMNINYIDFAKSTGVSLERAQAARVEAGLRIRGASRLPDGKVQIALAGLVEGALSPLSVSAFDLSGKSLFTRELAASGGEAEFSAPGLKGLVLLRVKQGGAWSESRPVYLGD